MSANPSIFFSFIILVREKERRRKKPRVNDALRADVTTQKEEKEQKK